MAKISKEKHEDTLNELDELFGKGVLEKASDKIDVVREWTNSGSITLDRATGGKGIPKGGKTTCVLGKESSGKSTLAQHIIAEETKKGGLCAILDIESSLDLTYASNIGINLNLLHVVNREKLLKSLGVKDRIVVSAEEWFDLLCKMLQSNYYEIIVLDSLAALQPMSEITTGMSGGRIASIASVLSKAYRSVSNSLSKSKTGFVYLNQYRINPSGYGNPFIEPGGEAWRYLQDLKIEISKSLDKDGTEVHGLEVKGKITKSKVCIPYQTFNYYIEFGKGIQRWKEILDLAIQEGIIDKKGNTYLFKEEKIGVGQKQLEDAMITHPELLQEIEDLLLNNKAVLTEKIEENESED